MTDSQRQPNDIEKTVSDVLGDLRGRGIDGPVARQIRDAADTRIKQTESDRSFQRAIEGRF